MHGVVLRLPATQSLPSSTPPRPPAAIKNMEQLMAEADPLHPVHQGSTMRLMKRPDGQARPSFLPPAERPSRPAIAQTPPSPQQATAPAAPAPPAVIAAPTAKLGVAPPTPLPALPLVKPPAAAGTPGVASSPVPRATALVPDSEFPTSGQAWPEFPPAEGSRPVPPRLIPPPPQIASAPAADSPSTTRGESPFILKPAVNLTAAPKPNPSPRLSPTAALLPFGPVARRMARMTDVARIVLPPKREEQAPALTSTGPIPTVVPSAFPVAGMTARPSPVPAQPQPVLSSPTVEKPGETPLETGANGAAALVEPPMMKDPPSPGALPVADDDEVEAPVAKSESSGAETKPEVTATPAAQPLLEEKTGEKAAAEAVASEAIPAAKPESVAATKPQEEPAGRPELEVDPEAHKPDAPDPLAPQLDPEAHQPKPPRAPEVSSSTGEPRKDEASAVSTASPKTSSIPLELGPSAASAERREFHLANGERVAGIVLSETPETVYVEHATLGVLTIPRAQLAKRLVEIILINGDRVVGDLMAETPDTLYVRHASLGMLTVPRAQRSTRVVEAILKNGDRILGEVLTETDQFTVIRSATLGTVTVQHANVAMLNRKIEQVELKALPPSSSELKNLPAPAEK